MFLMSLVGSDLPKESCFFLCMVFLDQDLSTVVLCMCEQEPLTANFPAVISVKAAQKNRNDGRTCLEGRS